MQSENPKSSWFHLSLSRWDRAAATAPCSLAGSIVWSVSHLLELRLFFQLLHLRIPSLIGFILCIKSIISHHLSVSLVAVQFKEFSSVYNMALSPLAVAIFFRCKSRDIFFRYALRCRRCRSSSSQCMSGNARKIFHVSRIIKYRFPNPT